MQNSKLLELFSTFSRKEIRQFTDFMRSPYFNTNETLMRFFELIAKHYPEFDSPKLEKEALHRSLFGKIKFDDVKMRGIISDTLELAEEFLALQNMKKKGLNTGVFLLNELNDRDLDALYSMRVDEVLRDKPGTVGNSWRFLNRYLVSAEHRVFLWKTNNDKKEKLIGSGLFEKPLQHLAEFFVHEGMCIGLDMRIMKQIIEYPGESPVMETVQSVYSQLEAVPEAMKFIELLGEVSAKDNENAFEELKGIVFSDAVKRMSDRDLDTCFTLLNDYCNYHYSSGSRKYVEDSFLLNKRIIELNIHNRNGVITETYFGNAVIEAVKVKEFDWARKFIRENAVYLKGPNKEDTIAYSLGTVYEQEGDLKEAIRWLNQVSKPTLQININIKCLLIKIYYAKGDLHQALISCTGLSKFLRSNKKYPDSRKAPLFAFIEIMAQLMKIRLGRSEQPIEELISEIEMHQNLGLKGWALRMAKEFKER
jgi:hypothetical protein